MLEIILGCSFLFNLFLVTKSIIKRAPSVGVTVGIVVFVILKNLAAKSNPFLVNS